MKAIGGYFGLELGKEISNYIFKNKMHLNSSRHALEYILLQEDSLPECVYLPYYTCEVVLEPLRRLGIAYKFYNIDRNLEIERLPKLRDGEMIIVNNYFGIKDKYVNQLMTQYKAQMIVDDAQALFHKGLPGMKTFYSPRKFVGLPDGGIALCDSSKFFELEQDYSTDRAIHLFRRIDQGAEAGFEEFKRDDADLSQQPLRKMSSLSELMLKSVDLETVKERRRINFKTLHEALGEQNFLNIPPIDTFSCPMVYPFLSNQLELRKKLIDDKIFVATYWPNVFDWCPPDSTEWYLAQYLLPIPIDQRYGEEDMKHIISKIIPSLLAN